MPEFSEDQSFSFYSKKEVKETKEAIDLDITAKPVLLSQVSFLWLGKTKDKDFDKLTLLNKIRLVYAEIITKLAALGVDAIQIDEPILTLELGEDYKQSILNFYTYLADEFEGINFICTTYFDDILENIFLINTLPIKTLHIDLTRESES